MNTGPDLRLFSTLVVIAALVAVVPAAHGDDSTATPIIEVTGAPVATPDGTAYGLLACYCVLIVAASLLGGWLPSRIALTHDRMQVVMSLVGGLMLGIGVYHLLPHGARELGSLDDGVWWTMAGMVVTFLLLRAFHFHQHGPVAHPIEGVHDHDCAHPEHDHGPAGAHELSWVGVFIGLSLHTLIDGIALGASVLSDARHGAGPLFGIGTFLAIVLHKPLDAVSITTLMGAGGWKPGHRNLVNLAYASMCPLGALLLVLGLHQLGGAEHVLVGAALCFAAGVFICIALGDILPEMEFHDHNRIKLTLVLLLGIALAWAIGLLEPPHAHV